MLHQMVKVAKCGLVGLDGQGIPTTAEITRAPLHLSWMAACGAMFQTKSGFIAQFQIAFRSLISQQTLTR